MDTEGRVIEGLEEPDQSYVKGRVLVRSYSLQDTELELKLKPF